MKKICYLLSALLFMTVACTEEKFEVPVITVSFEKQGQTLPDGSMDLNLVVSGLDKENTTEYVVGLECAGTATSEEYELSSDHFVIGGENPITSINVNSLNFSGEAKTLTLTLVPSEYVSLGKYPSTTVTMDSQDKIIYDFLEEELVLKAEVNPQIMLSLSDYSDAYYPISDMHIPVGVNKELSTAVLGEHFDFVGEPEFFMTPDDEFAKTQIKFLKKEEGKDKIVLEVDPKMARFIPGDMGKCTITIVGPDYNKIDGKWYVAEQVTDRNYMIKTAFVEEKDLAGFPEATAEDQFVFNTGENKLTTSLKSELKNFFRAGCNMKQAGGITIGSHDDGGWTQKNLELIELDNCNRDFSPTSTSSDKKAYIAFRLLKDEKTDEDILELDLIDYKSTSFCLAWNNLGVYNKEKPMATSAGCYLMFYLKRSK